MLTFALGTIATNHPEAIKDIGFFGLRHGRRKNCATIWMPAATYIPKTTTGDKLAAARISSGSSPPLKGPMRRPRRSRHRPVRHQGRQAAG
jgi:hypothetical protein